MRKHEIVSESLETLRLPLLLKGNYDHGTAPSAVSFHQELSRGVYELTLTVAEPEHNQLLLILLDDRPIESLGVPFWGDSDDNWPEGRRDRLTGERLEFTRSVKSRYKLPELYERRRNERRNWQLKTSFAVFEKRPFKISILNANGDRCGPLFYLGDGVNITAVALTRTALQAPDSFKRRYPGLPMLDAWGWMVYLGFDNPGGKEESPVYVVSEAIRRAKKWGANLLEMNPTVKDGHFFDFEADGGDPVPKAVRSRTTSWNMAQLKDLFRQCHQEGMLVELFLFSLGGFGMLRELSSAEIIHFYRRINQLLGCGATREATEAAIDGVIYEMFPHDAPRQTDEAWAHNPGLAQTVSGGVTGTAMELKNNGYSAAFANYTAHWVGFQAHHTGYDCVFPAVPYPKDFYRRPGEIAFSYLQGCAETRRLFEVDMVRTGYANHGFPGRTSEADWIYAQIQGFAQRRWRDEEDTVASLLCWEAVSAEICPESTKRALYAATQDPIRACLTGELTDTGRGGLIDMKRLLKKDPAEDLVRLLPRHEYPSTCRFLRNQDVELLLFPGKDCNVLQLDLTRSARFYANGCLVQAFSPLFCTTADDDSIMDFEESYQICQSGGAVAAAEQRLVVQSRSHRHHEVRRFTLLTDVPGIHVTVQRNATRLTAPKSVANIMGFNGGYTAMIRESDAGHLIVGLADPDKLLPELLIQVECRGASITDVDVNRRLAFRTDLSAPHALDIRILFAAGQFADSSFETLQRIVKPVFELEQADIGGVVDRVAVVNRLGLPYTATAALNGTLRSAVRVRENNWWYYRGVAESEESPAVNFVKLHLQKDETVEIADAERLIGGQLTWGWGSQYQLLLSDVNHRDDVHSAHVCVCSTTPFLFAPRVRLAQTPAMLRLNGHPWSYADGSEVFLPNEAGDYFLEWSYGNAAGPRLCRTFATVRRCEAEGDALLLDLDKPPHVTEEFGFHGYYALIESAGVRRIHPVQLGSNRIEPVEP